MLTWETDSLHLVSVVTAQRGVEALEVGVAAGDDGGRLVAAAGLDHVDGVELQPQTDSAGRPHAARLLLTLCAGA